MFELIKIINNQTNIFKFRYLLILVLNGVAYAIMLNVINIAIEMIHHQQQEFYLMLIFLLTYLLMFICSRIFADNVINQSERLIERRRNELFNLVCDADLLIIEHISKGEIYSRIATDTKTISNNAAVIADLLNILARALSVTIYMIFISDMGVVVILIGILTYGFIYKKINPHVARYTRQVDVQIGLLVSFVEHLISGFNELRVNHRKSDDLKAEFSRSAKQAMVIKRKTGMLYVTSFMVSQAVLFAIIGLIIFIFPNFYPVDAVLIGNLTAAVMFLFVPIDIIVYSKPMVSSVRSAFDSIDELRSTLRDNQRVENQVKRFKRSRFQYFSEIKLLNVSFTFYDSQQRPTFQFGPCDCTIHRGELIFIVGGNGSGKSIFLKLLTGLYYPEQGGLFVDEQLVTGSLYEECRDLFSIIFTDFHLFHRLLDFQPEKAGQVADLIAEMQLNHKTALHNDRFLTTDLSTGQRKRLAYIVARLEDRPVHIFDEFAADQDPIFKHFFYEKVLTKLKSEGKTILCVTHDEHYFHLADRIIIFDSGRYSEVDNFVDGDVTALFKGEKC